MRLYVVSRGLHANELAIVSQYTIKLTSSNEAGAEECEEERTQYTALHVHLHEQADDRGTIRVPSSRPRSAAREYRVHTSRKYSILCHTYVLS